MLKTLINIFVFCGLLVWTSSCVIAAQKVGADKPVSSQLVETLIVIEDEGLRYKDKFVPVPYTRKKLIEVFGKPSREIYNTAGTVVIWDELGLACYGCHEQAFDAKEFEFMSQEEEKQYLRRDYVESITLFVRRYNPYPDRENKYAHEPKRPFPGKLKLDGVVLDGLVSFDDFLRQRKGNQTILLPKNSFSFFIRCKPQPYEITMHTIRDKYDDDFMSIYSVSIRNIAHYYSKYKCQDVFEAPQSDADKVKNKLQQEPPQAPSSQPDDATTPDAQDGSNKQTETPALKQPDKNNTQPEPLFPQINI